MKKVWPFLFYLFYFGAASALFPFTALYYQSIGMTGAQIGLLTGIAPLITMLGAPFWTGLADTYQRHKLVMSVTMIGTILSALAIPFARSFLVLIPLVLVYSIIFSPVNSLADNATMTMLAEEREKYGRVRLGGTIGWGVMAYFSGVLIDRYGITWAYWIFAAGMAVTFLVSLQLAFSRTESQESLRSGMKILLANPRWILFLAMVFICGVGMTSINTYQFVYMAEIGASKTLMGLTLTVSTLSELPVMFFGNRLLDRFKPRGLLILGMAMIGVRVLLYAAFNFPEAILLIQAMHGLTFPVIWIAGVSYAHENAPAGLGATAQGLFGSMMMGFGAGVGGLLGGLLIDGVGGRGMYLVFGIIVLASLVLLTAFERRIVVPQTGTV